MVQFECPERDCKKEWSFAECCKVGVWTVRERKHYEEGLTRNFGRVNGIKNCPHCKALILKESDTCTNVKCTSCKGENFCWNCLQPWKTGNICMSNACIPKFDINFLLANCPTKEVWGVKNCPIVRACIFCGSLIEHVEMCNLMKCYSSSCKGKKQFCFICLQEKPHLGKQCTPAPRQKI